MDASKPKPIARNARPSGRRAKHGLSIVEVLIAVVVVAAALVIVLVTLGHSRDAARSASCTDNLRLLAKSAHEYANDHNDRFFYHWWQTGTKPDGTKGRAAGWWYDNRRLGQYLPDVQTVRLYNLHWDHKTPGGMISESRAAEHPDHDHYCVDMKLRELVKGPMVCPTHDDTIQRSYAMNFWASGVDRLPHVYLQTQFDIKEHRHNSGQFFDANPGQADKLILFTEGNIHQHTLRVDREDFFGGMSPPNIRFSGLRNIDGTLIVNLDTDMPSWLLDYTRHADTSGVLPQGAVNIAFADGHVSLRKSESLFNASGQSNYSVLWSENDMEIDKAFTAEWGK